MDDNSAVFGLIALIGIFFACIVAAVWSSQSKKPLKDVKPLGDTKVVKTNIAVSDVENNANASPVVKPTSFTIQTPKASIQYSICADGPVKYSIDYEQLVKGDFSVMVDVVDLVLEKVGFAITPLQMTNAEIVERVEEGFNSKLVNGVFLKDEFCTPTITKEKDWGMDAGYLFQPVCEAFDHPPSLICYGSTSWRFSDLVTPGKAAVVIGVGGLYFLTSETKDESRYCVLSMKDIKQKEYPTFGLLSIGQKTPVDFVVDIRHCLYMPSITKEVINKMQQKDMTNIPYYGEFYRADGYAVVEVRMDNEIYVFCSAAGYHGDTDYSDVKEHSLVHDLVLWRARRDERLKKTDYGYVLNEDKAPVYWYV